MKIGIDGRELQKEKMTGIGRYILNFLKYAPQYKPNWEFIIFINQHTEINLENFNLKKKFIPEYLTFWWDQAKLPYYIKREQIDLFFSPYYKAPIFTRCKTIITIHDLALLRGFFYTGINNFLLKIYLKTIGRFIAERTNKIITDSNYSKRDIINIFKIPEEKVKVIYEGVEERYFPRNKLQALKDIRKKYGIRENYILYLGNLWPRKNVEGLLKAYKQLPKNLRDNHQIVIVGDRNRYFNSLSNLAKELQIENNITVTGFIRESDLPFLYSAAQIFVFPSYYEGFGLPVLEAMACGTPVITSNTTSLPEVVESAGILVDPSNIYDISKAMKELLTNANLRLTMRERGLKRAKQFPAKKMVCKILDLFAEVINKKVAS